MKSKREVRRARHRAPTKAHIVGIERTVNTSDGIVRRTILRFRDDYGEMRQLSVSVPTDSMSGRILTIESYERSVGRPFVVLVVSGVSSRHEKDHDRREHGFLAHMRQVKKEFPSLRFSEIRGSRETVRLAGHCRQVTAYYAVWARPRDEAAALSACMLHVDVCGRIIGFNPDETTGTTAHEAPSSRLKYHGRHEASSYGMTPAHDAAIAGMVPAKKYKE